MKKYSYNKFFGSSNRTSPMKAIFVIWVFVFAPDIYGQMDESAASGKDSSDNAFMEAKDRFYRLIAGYYGQDATDSGDIRERLQYFREALDSLDSTTYRNIKNKFITPDGRACIADKDFEMLVVFGAYYPYWIFLGTRRAREIAASDRLV